MWRLLIQLRVLLPYLAKVLPLVERSLLGTNITGHAAPTIDTSNLDRGIAGVGEAQRDLKTAVKGPDRRDPSPAGAGCRAYQVDRKEPAAE